MLRKSGKKEWSKPNVFVLSNHSVSSGVTVGNAEGITFGNSGGCGKAVMLDPGKTTTYSVNFCPSPGTGSGCDSLLLNFKAVGSTPSLPSIGLCS